ncbi:hypothetical protein [Georgenia sp. H159]|uniref:hypothetical protein n=1 Tax=Georgenia sp. H159 TaxID=3076115 RepID=UPI002D78A5E2|nr:hypothetical protein [Georgenia sp. H159]
MGRNDATEDDAATGTAANGLAALVGTGTTVLVVGTAPAALAEELRGRGSDVTVLERRPTPQHDDAEAAVGGGADWASELGACTFDVVVLDDGALSGPGDATPALAAAASRLRPGGTVVVQAPDGPVRLARADGGTVAPQGAAAGDDDEVAELKHRLLTLRDHVIGLEATTATARAQAARAQREAQQQLEEMAASATWRAGRLAVAPASWARRRIAGRG